MEIKSFAELIREEVKRRTDREVRIQKVTKNNGLVLQGITIMQSGCNIAPTIYLEPYFKDYENGRSIDSIVSAVLEVAQDKKMDKTFDMSWFRDFENVRDKVAYKLINYEANRELLKSLPHEKFLDLAKVYYVSVNIKGGTGTILIHNSHLELWEITQEQLLTIAEENITRLLPARIDNMCEVMKNIELDDMLPQELQEEVMSDCHMYVATNLEKTFGAAVMCYPYAIKRLAERLKSDLFILPSSIHEVIIVLSKGEECTNELRTMVYEVNRTQLAAEEFLSDSVYYYSREEGTIRIA